MNIFPQKNHYSERLVNINDYGDAEMGRKIVIQVNHKREDTKDLWWKKYLQKQICI